MGAGAATPWSPRDGWPCRSVVSKSLIFVLVQNLRVPLAGRSPVVHHGLRFGVHLCRQQDEGEGSAPAMRLAAVRPLTPATSGRSPGPGQLCRVRAAGSFTPSLRSHISPRVPVSPQGPELGSVDGRRVSCLVTETVHKWVFAALTAQGPGVALSSGCTWLCRLAIWPWGARPSAPRAGRSPAAFS